MVFNIFKYKKNDRLVPTVELPLSPIRLAGRFKSWEEASSVSRGYADVAITRRAIDQTLQHNKDVDLIAPRISGNKETQILAAILFASLSIDVNNINIVDFGGEFGAVYSSIRNFLPFDVSWRIHEQFDIVSESKNYFPGLSMEFASGDMPFECSPHIILASGVLQAVPNPYEILLDAAKSSAVFMIIAQHPMINGDHDIITQRFLSDGDFQTSYPLTLFSSAGFRLFLQRYWNIEMEWLVADKKDNLDGLDVEYVGMLLKKK